MTPDRPAGAHPLWWAALGAMCLVLLAPLLVVDMPPLVDYPNHLARLFVLAALPDDPVIARFYAAHWGVIPNLALDLLGPPLLRLMPVHDAGRVLIGASVLLPVLGTVAYGVTLGGRWWPLAAGLAAYNQTLLEGFLNFNLGIGVALLLAAGWTRWRERFPLAMTAFAMLGTVALFACHLMSVVLFAVAIGADELVRLLADGVAPRRVAGAGARVALILACPLLLYMASPLQALGGDAAYLALGGKAAQLMAPFVNYVWTLDVLTAVLAFGFPCVCLLWRRGRVMPPVLIAGALVLGAYLVMPYAWKGTQQLDTRFAIMLGFLLFAGFLPVRWPGWLSGAVTVAVVALFFGRMAVLTVAWTGHRADLADLRAALRPVQPGQAVYVIVARPVDPDGYAVHAPWSRRLSDGISTGTHLGALGLIEHRAWWPFEFDNASQQPMRTLEPYQAMALRVGEMPDQYALKTADLCGFDVVLVLQADGAPPLPAPRFRPLAGRGFARSYGIEACPPGD
jgi:hypothetical protein